MKKPLLVALSLIAAAGPAFAALETGNPAVDAGAQAKREKVIVGFYGMMKGMLAAAPGADKAQAPDIRSLADLDEAACQAYARGLISANMSLQMHRQQFAADPETYDIAQMGTMLGVNSTYMLCGTAGKLERAKDPIKADKTCADELAKPEPFSDPALKDIQGSKNLSDRFKTIFSAVHEAVASQSRANCAAR